MGRRLNRSQTLRYLANQFLAGLPDDGLTSPRADLSTSLVRQWLTNDDHATLFIGDEQHYLRPSIKSEDSAAIDGNRVGAGSWFRQIMRDWEVDEPTLREGIRQLNIGQSATVENRRGEFLRLWVRAKERSRGVEPLSKSLQRPAAARRDLAKIARDQVDDVFEGGLDPTIRGELVGSIVRQWTANDGHALILTPSAKVQFIVRPKADGGTDVIQKRLDSNLPQKLGSCGVPADDLPYFLHAINLGQAVEVTDESGRRVRVEVDPVNATVGMRLVLARPADRHTLRIDDLDQ
jgi:hypothetical protein